MLIQLMIVIALSALVYAAGFLLEKRLSQKKLNYSTVNKTKVTAIPQKAHKNDAGFDFTASSIEVDHENNIIEYGTNIAVQIPEGYVGLLFPRSSIYKTNLLLSNGVGVIDAGYRGEVKFKFQATRSIISKSITAIEASPKYYSPGDRIGQLVVVRLDPMQLIPKRLLSRSARGTGGYGSTGN